MGYVTSLSSRKGPEINAKTIYRFFTYATLDSSDASFFKHEFIVCCLHNLRQLKSTSLIIRAEQYAE